MRIVRIIARLNVGGPARHVVWLTQGLQNEEFESVLITGTVPDGEEDMSFFAGRHGVDPIFIEEMSRELSPKDIVSLWKVFRRIVAEKPDVIHTHTAKAGTIGRIAGFLYRWLYWRRVALIHTFHGHVFHSYYGPMKTSVFIAIERALALVTDRIVVISNRQRDEILGEFGVGSEGQFRVIPLGLDLGQFAQAESRRELLRREIGANDDDVVFGFVGRLTDIKNLPLLFEAIRILARDSAVESSRARFVIIGDGHLRDELEATARALGIEDRVDFLGNRENPADFYPGLDVVVLTSHNEGTPLSLIEGMANSRPFVATNVGGVADLAGATVTSDCNVKVCERGIIVEAGDAGALAKAISMICDDADLRVALGRRGNRFVTQNYGRERLTEDISALYREAVAK